MGWCQSVRQCGQIFLFLLETESRTHSVMVLILRTNTQCLLLLKKQAWFRFQGKTYGIYYGQCGKDAIIINEFSFFLQIIITPILIPLQ